MATITQISLGQRYEKRSICCYLFFFLIDYLTYIFLIPSHLCGYHIFTAGLLHLTILTNSDHLSCSWPWSCPTYNLFLFFSLHKMQMLHWPHSVTLNYVPIPHLLPVFFFCHSSYCFLFNFSTHSCSFLQMLHNSQKAHSIQFRIAYTCPLSDHFFSDNTPSWPQKRKYLGDISLNYTGQLGRYQIFLLTDWLSETILKTLLSPVI